MKQMKQQIRFSTSSYASYDFNEAVFDANQKILEEVVYSVAGSVFANYDASAVVFQVNGHDFLTKSKKDIENY